MSRNFSSVVRDADELPQRAGHHPDFQTGIADGSMVESVDFDWGSLEAVSELPQSDAERLSEALRGVMDWMLDRRLSETKNDRADTEAAVARALRSTATKCLLLGMFLTPAAIGPKKLREAARLVGMDEARLRRLAKQIEDRFKLKNPFKRA